MDCSCCHLHQISTCQCHHDKGLLTGMCGLVVSVATGGALALAKLPAAVFLTGPTIGGVASLITLAVLGIKKNRVHAHIPKIEEKTELSPLIHRQPSPVISQQPLAASASLPPPKIAIEAALEYKLISKGEPFCSRKSDEDLINDFTEVVDNEMFLLPPGYEVRQYDEAWRDRSRAVSIVPYEENTYCLNSGQILNASTLPFGFIATQIPIMFKKETNKYETVSQFEELIRQSGAKVIVEIGASEESYIPDFEDVKLIRLDDWKNKQPYDFAAILSAIETVQRHREDKSVVVMCSNGSTLTCTYIACHLVYQIYQDCEGYQLDLKQLHQLLRLGPTGRYAAINFKDHYKLINDFANWLVKT